MMKLYILVVLALVVALIRFGTPNTRSSSTSNKYLKSALRGGDGALKVAVVNVATGADDDMGDDNEYYDEEDDEEEVEKKKAIGEAEKK